MIDFSNLKEDELIEKINYYAKKKDMTEEEKKEQMEYRNEYIKRMKQSLRSNLDSIKIIDKE